MNGIKIVEYERAHAKSLADMWNMSADNWGGSDSIYTEESAIEENENTGNINTYVAIDGEKVVGYCSFSEYRQDDGAMYIPLLNVRPDYHGKKVGKQLVLQTVKRTIELGWPRLDLYTWAGNTKAVPLYKKCGFFWEKRDDATHLMNFIPTVMQTEAVKEYFEIFDWYEDSKRDIAVSPDGNEEDNYSNYEYLWEKDGKHLRMVFERKGRGLRLIDTNDYIISADISEKDLVFGREYNITYHVVNKTGKKLDIAIKGKNDKNITFSFEAEASVADEKTFIANFFVGEIEEEQSHWRTHPCVIAEIMINGKRAFLKVGINPKFPAKLSLTAPDVQKLKNVSSDFYIDIQNNFNEDTVFEFTLPDSDDIDFEDRSFSIPLKPKEKASILISYTLNNPFLYQAMLNIKATLNNEVVEFKKKISLYFNGYTGRFGGETDEQWIVYNGNYSLHLNKFDNDLIVKKYPDTVHEMIVFYPRVGLPFSLEFSKEKPHTVENYCEDDYIALKAFYNSRDFKNIQLISLSKLYPNGIVEHNYEVQNITDKDTDEDVWFSQSYYYDLADAVIPYDTEFVEINGYDSTSLDYWDSSKFTENWIYSSEGKSTFSFCWPKEDKIKFNMWYFSIDKNLGKIPANSSISTEPCFIAIDTFKDWKELRKFAVKHDCNDDLHTISKLEFSINDGNPFVGKSFNAAFKEYRKSYFDGVITLSSKNDLFEPIVKNFSKEDFVNNTEMIVSLDNNANIDILSLGVDFESVAFQKKIAIFKTNNDTINSERTFENELEIFSVDNGEIKIKSSPQFANSIFSLVYNGHEWLDTSFPTPTPKSWWNPWTGGIISHPRELTLISLSEEEKEADFIQIKDSLGNMWSGIKISANIRKNDKFKGLEMYQYYLMLPGLPVLCCTTEIVQKTGYYFNSVEYMTEVFMKLDEELKNNRFTMQNQSGEMVTYKAGKAFDIRTNGSITFEGVNRTDKMMVYSNGDVPLWGFSNNEAVGSFVINKIEAKNNTQFFMPPAFLIFTKEAIDHDLLKNLRNIKF